MPEYFIKKVACIIMLLITTLFVSAQKRSLTQTIKGLILDDLSGNTLRSATVIVDGIKPTSVTLTDSTGSFKLLHVPVGRQNIKISLVGYENAFIQNIEITSSKEVFLEIRMKEIIKILNEVVVTNNKKIKAINETALASARQLSIDEAVRYAGTRNDPSRMAQNFAGVSGSNDVRNDIIIRGNSPSGVLWRMDGIDIPNPNHFSAMGSTGGPVTMLNTNTLKNSDFITSAFPAQYGNAIAGVFDLRLRNGNNEKNEYLWQMGFNGFEFGVEGPLNKANKSSYLVNYRYSMVAAIQAIGLNVGTGSAIPFYQDASFKLHIVTKKFGTFDWFGLGGESHINFPPDSSEYLYGSNDGTLRNRKVKSLTGVIGITNTFFLNPTTSGKTVVAISTMQENYGEEIINSPNKTASTVNNTQIKVSVGYTLNKKFNSKNQLTTGLLTDISFLNLRNDYLPNGDTVLTTLTQVQTSTTLAKFFINFSHRISNQLSTNFGLYTQWLSLNNTESIEPRWNFKYQFHQNQSIYFGAGLHSQTQPLEMYFHQTPDINGQLQLTNKSLDFVKSIHTVAGYDINFLNHMRFKVELYWQYIYRAAVETKSSSFSMLNTGAAYDPITKSYLINNGSGYNCGVEITLEKFLHQGFYYLITSSLFQSKYKGSDNVWRNTAFNSNYVSNFLIGKEFKYSSKSSFGIDTKLAVAGGQRYTPYDMQASQTAGYVIYKENEAYSLQNNTYIRWDLKFSYTRNNKNNTQKLYIDLQNLTNKKNIYIRSLNPITGHVSEINQMGFFPNINYQITF